MKNTFLYKPSLTKSKSFLVILLLGILYSLPTLAQQKGRTVNGKVLDETQEALIGVSVVQKNTTNATVTNTDGEFNIELIAGEQVLIISYLL